MIIAKFNNIKIYGKNITYSVIKGQNYKYESFIKLDNKDYYLISDSYEEANKFICQKIKNLLREVIYD